MIHVLVTVGTTSFDSLIKVLDRYSDEIQFVFQIANGKYLVKYHESIDFIENIENIYSDFDLIITHAGAGTVYKLLESDIPFIVVPNTERSDKHQLELSKFVGMNLLAKVATVDDFAEKEHFRIINDAIAFERIKYTKKPFFIKSNIIFG